MTDAKKLLEHYISTQPYESPRRATKYHVEGYEAKFGKLLPGSPDAAIADVLAHGHGVRFQEYLREL